MSAPVYVGKHAAPRPYPSYKARHACIGCRVCQDTGALYMSWPHFSGLVRRPCPNGCIARQLHHVIVPGLLLEAPVAVVPSSSAVAVKAGGVATLTGGDTTQPGIGES